MADPFLPGGDDTIAAIATAPGRGAIAIVRLSGPLALDITSRLASEFDRSTARVAQLVSVRHPGDASLLDEALVTFFRGPHSYTGEDVVEISVHGGVVSPALVLNAVIGAGARQALPGEFTRRAVANGRLDLVQAEAVGDLIDAQSRLAHRVAVNQLDGGLSRRTAALRDTVLHVEALIAYDIDFPEEDEGAIDHRRVDEALMGTMKALDDLLATSDTGEMLREGALVVIGGAPNAGKSSLFNALIGRERAIVTDIAGTTRDAIEAVIEVETWPVRLVDTAGLRESTDVVERLGIEISEHYLGNADIVLLCADEPKDLPRLLHRTSALTSAPIIPIQTKADLNIASSRGGPPDVLRLSALTGEGLIALTERIRVLLSSRFLSATSEVPLLTRERHRAAVAAARAELTAFRETWAAGAVPSVVAAVHLREAAHHLEELIGSVDVEDVLDRVFSTFCVGK